jgi:hypothetical protein
VRTRGEWLAYFIGLGMDNGTIWHFMRAMYAFGVVAGSKRDGP